MKIGIISDIHSNYEALSSVLHELKGNVDKIFSLGDTIGYGADPDKCIDLLIENNVFSIIGNHDYALIYNDYLNSFNPVAKQAILFAKKKLKKHHIEYIKKSPIRIKEKNMEFVHAGFYFPDAWPYINISNIKQHFNYLNESIGFFGHTHIPIIYSQKPDKTIESLHNKEKIFHLKNNYKYIINPGSVGQPRDKNPNSSYIVFDTEEKKCYFYRIKYNIKKSAKKILLAGLDDFLAHRLTIGE